MSKVSKMIVDDINAALLSLKFWPIGFCKVIDIG